ncbi:Ger(x)C family spore germination protein [Metabacillus fastidiosus]|uniref:Ger(x)C family spore germination protein n=1 Tax=Metabacillus fastidiosus TaxID=1458 RepID=UPI002DBB40CE|nr:Ger(x)C family spore germination protein [Metabacillus fastidiosus]MEC2074940.1 Ger(x)C family spore germination protein [Metabacillus fastidiosus]
MKHLLKTIIVLTSIVLVLSSCGYKDIDKRFFVVTIGIDKAEDTDKKYKIMLKIAVPSPEVTSEQPKFIVSEHESNSVTGAVRMIKTKLSKELDFSHAKMVLFGEEIAKEDVSELTDWLIRRRDIQKIAWVGVGKPSAESILTMNRITEEIPSNALFLTFGNIGTDSVYILSERLFDFRKRITENGLSPILPIIEKKGEGEREYFEVSDGAVLDNKKIKMILSSEDTKILNIMLERMEHADIRVNKDGEEFFYLASETSSVKYKIRAEKGKKPTVDIHIRIAGILEEELQYTGETNLTEYEKVAEQQVKQRVLRLLTSLQKENLDPIGFGLSYRATHFNENDWEEWLAIYPDIDFNIDVDIKIEGTGLLK